MKLKPLVIGNLVAPVPIIQGGMGVGISLSRLAGAVAKVAQRGFGVPAPTNTNVVDPEPSPAL